MKKQLGAVFALALALAMAAALGACASTDNSNSSASGSPAAQEQSLDTGVYEGTLVMASQNELVVSGSQGDTQFTTSKDTIYDLGDLDEIFLDDIVSVKFHSDGNGKQADEITLVEHMDTALPFAGTLIDWDDDTLTLSNNSQTVTFQRDADTYTVGDLSLGDGIELTYLGDLSEYPYANVVAVVTEAEMPNTNTAHGVVSEVIDGTVLLGVDSAHAYRFAVTANTAITGAANDVNTGDQVDIVYAGGIKNTPEALSINIIKQGQNRAYVINGKISGVGQNSVTLDTGKAKYTFGTSANTRYYGDKPANGYSAEITYTGSLIDNPQAGIVYCVKDVKTTSKTTAKKQAQKTGKKSGTASAQSSVSTSSTETSEQSDSADSGTNKGDQSASSQASAPTPQAVSSEAATVTEQQSNPEEQPSPEASNPEEQPSAEASNPDEQPSPETSDPDKQPSPEASDPDEQPSPESSEPQIAADPKVSGQGTIVKGEERSVVIKMNNGDELKLTIDENTNISSGYIPEKGDIVKISYSSTSMTLKDIQLVSRAEKAEKAEAPEKAAEEQPPADTATNTKDTANDANDAGNTDDASGADDAGNADDTGGADDAEADAADEE